MKASGVAACLLAACVLGLTVRGALLAFAPGSASGIATRSPRGQPQASFHQPPAFDVEGKATEAMEDAAPWSSAARFAAGAALGALLLVASMSPARADLEDTAIPVDGKGKTVNLSKEEIIRGKRLFNAACAVCHVGGGTRTNQNVGLGFEELSGAQPPRNTIDGLVDYLNAPTTYDGLKDISEVHPSIKAADVWPKMRTMKQKDLYDMSAYILYQNFTIPEKWGGGKQYY
uniref:Cytochrome c domain-containing protein n=1 Tax=Alexandrium monilatum TaxID=311494 RepID=A0A7S4RGR3_9DINO